jgi:hypothetical protein
VGRHALARRAGDPSPCLALALGWQTVRIEGLHGSLSVAGLRLRLIDHAGFKDRLAQAQADLARITAAQARPAPIRPLPTINRRPSPPGLRRSPMPKLPNIMRGPCCWRCLGCCSQPARGLPCVWRRRPRSARSRSPAPLDDRSGDPAAVVALSRADFDLCTDNSARLAKVHQDALALIAQGVAIASQTP